MAQVEYYEDKAGEWRWRVRAANGRIVADGGEGYRRRDDAEAGYRLALDSGRAGDDET